MLNMESVGKEIK